MRARSQRRTGNRLVALEHHARGSLQCVAAAITRRTGGNCLHWRQPGTCPVHLLPYLAWAFSVDRWDRNWPEETKRQVIRDAWLIHRHKGTISALRRAIEPLGYLIRVSEWWEFDGEPGTFKVDVGTLDSGVTEEMYLEMERLIADAKPASRHLIGLNIIQDIPGYLYTGGVVCDGDVITVYPG